MITTYSRGNVTLTVDQPAGTDQATFAIARTEPLTDDETRRVNDELASHSAAQGAQLVQDPDTGETLVIRPGHGADAIVARDEGDAGHLLTWTAGWPRE
ncbi:hypothetical protein ACT17_34330 [Mycolicibacterium conceptionense]|uniref:Uncharacterized protein n=1 Tax=Mycolicibacterium conceptionense TaxID=451644 RepID=A0A0J8TWV9_9MYCO|nr:hypothetical protein [Mycolicibacterium conceptionense]KMV13632.1 hypothetical protein ACT17_34330 [Mycolicibacterium conceptionense]